MSICVWVSPLLRINKPPNSSFNKIKPVRGSYHSWHQKNLEIQLKLTNGQIYTGLSLVILSYDVIFWCHFTLSPFMTLMGNIQFSIIMVGQSVRPLVQERSTQACYDYSIYFKLGRVIPVTVSYHLESVSSLYLILECPHVYFNLLTKNMFIFFSLSVS